MGLLGADDGALDSLGSEEGSLDGGVDMQVRRTARWTRSAGPMAHSTAALIARLRGRPDGLVGWSDGSLDGGPDPPGSAVGEGSPGGSLDGTAVTDGDGLGDGVTVADGGGVGAGQEMTTSNRRSATAAVEACVCGVTSAWTLRPPSPV